MPTCAVTKKDHQQHHAYTAGPDDADQQFIAYLGARFDGMGRFVLTLLDPVFHYRFLKARLGAVLLRGPVWRRVFGLAALLTFVMLAPAGWLVTAVVGFQAATLMQWATEHLWGKRPAGLGAVETATAVTFGRLLLPDAGDWWKLAGYTIFRAILLSGDLPNHDLQHMGRGPWVDAAYIRTRLILAGRIEMRQTVSLRAMFRVAFDSAGDGGRREERLARWVRGACWGCKVKVLQGAGSWGTSSIGTTRATGCLAFVEITDPWTAKNDIRGFLDNEAGEHR